jgi:LacI family transcriptional regulator
VASSGSSGTQIPINGQFFDLIGSVLYGDWSEAWGRQAVQILLRSGGSFDAIYCGSDQLARGAAEALRDEGLRVPLDVALVGTDNWDLMAEGRAPSLTTIDMDLHEIGRTAADYLLEAIDGQPRHGVDILPCHLVVRESTEQKRPVRQREAGRRTPSVRGPRQAQSTN